MKNSLFMNKLFSVFALALLTALPVRGEDSLTADSMQVFVQWGDSCMQQYNTFEALTYYQRAYDIAEAQDSVRFSMDQSDVFGYYAPEDKVPRQIRLKLADCCYKRADYRQTSELLKNMPEDSLSHEAFRELALSYKKQGDTDSYVYWTNRLVERFPMDGEMVAGLILGYAQLNQPEKGLTLGLNYSLKDRTNILVNRAIADAFFLKRDFTAAGIWYDQLLEQGDSTFNTLYSAGMSHSQTGNLERAYTCLIRALELSQLQHAGCAYRLGVVCVDTKRFEEGLAALDLATELTKPDTVMMKAITLSQGEGYYLTEHYPEAIEAWKRHLDYNPGSIATYYNIAQTYGTLLGDHEQEESYYRQFLTLAEQEPANDKLSQMIQQARSILKDKKP